MFFFFNYTATTEIYTLSLPDALPISDWFATTAAPCALLTRARSATARGAGTTAGVEQSATDRDRKSTRLNSSHANISYAVFCLKKKKHIIDIKPTILTTIMTFIPITR